MRAGRYLMGTLAAVLLFTGCSGSSGKAKAQATPPPETHTLAGDFVLNYASGGGWGYEGADCSGGGGYSDIREGTSVVVTDDAGKTLGLGQLQAGSAQLNAYQAPVICKFHFAVPDLPDSRFYKVEVSHRGEQTYSKQQLESSLWLVTLTLGS